MTMKGDVHPAYETKHKQVEGHDQLVDVTMPSVDEMVNVMKDEVTTANEDAKKRERISYQVREQLGAEVRKRRKSDLEEIAALKRENMALTKSIIEKDKVAATDMATLKEEMADVRAGFVAMKASFDALLVGVVNKYKSSRRRV